MIFSGTVRRSYRERLLPKNPRRAGFYDVPAGAHFPGATGTSMARLSIAVNFFRDTSLAPRLTR